MPKLRPSLLFAFAIVTALTVSCTRPGTPNAQNWSSADQQAWYRASQGSRLIPYAWLMALEGDDGQPFMRPATTLKYRYLLAAAGDPSQLPIGFAIDKNRHGVELAETDLRWFKGQGVHEPWVGLNCSACHTAELDVAGQKVRVDGGPTLADFQGFTDALRATLHATRTDPARWDRFLGHILAADPAAHRPSRDIAANREMLTGVFDLFLKRMDQLAALNQPMPDDPVYGPGRLDAVGHILNKVAYLAKADGQFNAPPGAPVSYPFLWNVPQHAQVQWNGIAPNLPLKVGGRTVLDAGALVRNASEVIGVFADVQIVKREGLDKINGYPSSIDVRNLAAMETQLERLKPPRWPANLKQPDPAMVAYGHTLFTTTCSGCHTELPRDDLTSPAKEKMTPIFGPGSVGTDIWMACNAYSFRARTGNLAGAYPTYIKSDKAAAMGPVAETRSMLTAEAIGAVAGKKKQIIEAAATGLFDRYQRPTVLSVYAQTAQSDRATRQQECQDAWAATDAQKPDRGLLQYKGRPLGGIWATGPYLHNGSVRTLWELLLAPEKRSQSFHVGSRRFDAQDVGFVDEETPGGFVFKTHDAAGNWIPGNDNRGHSYGTGLTDADKRALVEYMKSL